MIIGTGIDLVELARIQQLAERQPRFITRVLTEAEQKEYALLSAGRKTEFLAGRFAAKEAFVKAVGTGISATFSWLDLEVRKEETGKPYLVARNYDQKVHLSISHSKTQAIAQVIIESLES